MTVTANPSRTPLCYLQAGQVDGPSGKLVGLKLCDCHDAVIGTLDGVLLDPSERRVRYFVVQSAALAGPRRVLLPVESALTIEPDATAAGGARLIALTEDLDMQPFDPGLFRPFSDEDALAAMFAA
jgi:PRC-barrel domain protein